VIDHFKIFCNFVDQAYFLQSQRLESLKSELRQIEIQIPRDKDIRVKARAELESSLNIFRAISGVSLEVDIDRSIRRPTELLTQLRATPITVVPTSDEHAVQRELFESNKAQAVADLRRHQNRLRAIRASIDYAKQYTEEVLDVAVPSDADLLAAFCPFCDSNHNQIEIEANRLHEAIVWLNSELGRSRSMTISFESEKYKLEQRVDELKQKVVSWDEQIGVLDEQISEMSAFRSQYELSLRAKLNVESILEKLLDRQDQELEASLAQIKREIDSIEQILKQYDVAAKMERAEAYIQHSMTQIAEKFDFEESYRPVNLHFSLSTFDLWHQAPDRRVYLRSMGSGANWLYSHLTLFLAMHKYFCSLGDDCSVPSILFFDQPSQVYFPSSLDIAEKFSAEDLAKLEGESRKRPLDEDMAAVTNVYAQLLRFCSETYDQTGINPQIIVTDHADNLTLEGDVPFEEFVRARWRTRGFVDTALLSTIHTQ